MFWWNTKMLCKNIDHFPYEILVLCKNIMINPRELWKMQKYRSFSSRNRHGPNGPNNSSIEFIFSKVEKLFFEKLKDIFNKEKTKQGLRKIKISKTFWEKNKCSKNSTGKFLKKIFKSMFWWNAKMVCKNIDHFSYEILARCKNIVLKPRELWKMQKYRSFSSMNRHGPNGPNISSRY